MWTTVATLARGEFPKRVLFSQFTIFSRAMSRCMGAAMSGLGWVSMSGLGWEFSGVVRSCFTLFRSTILTDVSLNQTEGSFNPLFKAILYSVSWVRRLVNTEWHAWLTLPLKAKRQRGRKISTPAQSDTASRKVKLVTIQNKETSSARKGCLTVFCIRSS